MKAEELASGTSDTLSIKTPADRFMKTCHDTTAEGKTILYAAKPEIRSFFTGHLLTSGSTQPYPLNRYQPDWILALLILCFMVQAWVLFLYRTRFSQLVQAPFSRRFLNQLLREGNLFNERISLALGFIYFISIALLVFEINELLLGGFTPALFRDFTFYLLIILCLLLFWLVKVTGILLLGNIFKTENITRMYLLNVLIINIITGIVLIPLLVLVIYLKSVLVIYISMVIIILSLVFLLVRGFLIGLSLTKFSYIFLFVYLCTLEILPLIILVKVSLLFYNSMISVN